MRWKPDQLDIWCTDWARERRKIFGITLPEAMQPWERLGKLRSTLGTIEKDREAAGAGSVGHNQQFPEVYLGLSLEIHRGFVTMCGEWRQVMDAQYVWREVAPLEKAAVIGLTVPGYFNVLRMLKAYLSGYLHLDNSTLLARAE